ncbi:MAG: hypothetical protein LBQ98_03595, partial [Nitrososphaerota archaeon]|nr:hypothetical protein [Nitrososphaerota archaeon]
MWPLTQNMQTNEAAFFAGVSEQNSGVFDAGLSLSVLTVFFACVVMVSGFAVVCMGRAKKLPYTGLFKRHGLKVGGLVLCVILSSTMFLGALETASATTRGAVVWGSESTGDSSRKSQNEINHQKDAGVYIGGFFQTGGYAGNGGINHQGSAGLGSSANQITSDIAALYSSKDCVAVVDFNHGVGRTDYFGAPKGEFHYLFEDQVGTTDNGVDKPGNAVYDCEVYNLAIQSKTVFSFISTCMSADLSQGGQGVLPAQFPYFARARGMPFAWTGRLVSSMGMQGFTISERISSDGYGNPDWGNQVYIGFMGGSASLEQSVPTIGGNPYYYWVVSFLGNALTFDKSVNEALDAASLQFMGCTFSSSPLRTGFTPYWAGYPYPQPSSTLAVYGNGNIHLKNFEPHTVSVPSISGPTSNPVGTSNSFTVSSVDSLGHRIRYIFDWA